MLMCVYQVYAHVFPQGIHTTGLTMQLDHGATPALFLSGCWTQCLLTKVTKIACGHEPGNLEVYNMSARLEMALRLSRNFPRSSQFEEYL